MVDVNKDGVINLQELRLMLSGKGPLTAVLPDGKTVEQVLAEVDTSHDGVISFDEFKAYLARESQASDGTDHTVDAEEPLSVSMPRLASLVNRPEAALAEQASRLAELHWINTVGDLQKLAETDWPRLGLPLMLERVLRAYVGP